MKVYYDTFGCKVNQYETEALRQRMALQGYEDAPTHAEADICIINTCTVTAQSDKKCLKLVRRIRAENPTCVTVLAGCYPQAFPQEAQQAGCDIIVGTAGKTKIPELLAEFLQSREPIQAVAPHCTGEVFETSAIDTLQENRRKTRGIIKIQDGCDSYCSYCIIPKARGHLRSKPAEEIRKEAEQLAINHRELVLTGINLSCYGKDFADGTTLCDAVCAAAIPQPIARVRLGSLEPELLTDEIIARLAAEPKLCPQFHLSLQSGCEKTLRAMHRRYTPEEYRRLCEKLRDVFPNCAITTDVMVGFPGETQEDFQQSREFVRACGFARTHIFPYSPRHGTKAAEFPNQIPQEEKLRRAALMEQTAQACEREFLERMVGKTVQVLFEKENCTEFHRGYSENYTLVKIVRKNAEKSLRGALFCVKIKKAEDGFCLGEILP